MGRLITGTLVAAGLFASMGTMPLLTATWNKIVEGGQDHVQLGFNKAVSLVILGNLFVGAGWMMNKTGVKPGWNRPTMMATAMLTTAFFSGFCLTWCKELSNIAQLVARVENKQFQCLANGQAIDCSVHVLKCLAGHSG